MLLVFSNLTDFPVHDSKGDIWQVSQAFEEYSGAKKSKRRLHFGHAVRHFICSGMFTWRLLCHIQLPWNKTVMTHDYYEIVISTATWVMGLLLLLGTVEFFFKFWLLMFVLGLLELAASLKFSQTSWKRFYHWSTLFCDIESPPKTFLTSEHAQTIAKHTEVSLQYLLNKDKQSVGVTLKARLPICKQIMNLIDKDFLFLSQSSNCVYLFICASSKN